MASGPRTFHNSTFNELGRSYTALSQHLWPRLTGKESTLTSSEIWSKLVPGSYYHVFTNDPDVYVANLVGDVTTEKLQLREIYKHKTRSFARFTRDDERALENEIDEYFLFSIRVDSRPQDNNNNFKLDKLLNLHGSHVAVYTNGAIDMLYSAPSNVFVESTSTSQSSSTSSATVPGQITNREMVPSPSPGPSASTAEIVVTPRPDVLVVTPRPDVLVVTPRPGAQQIAQQVAQPVVQQIDGQIAQQIAQQVAQQVAQSNGGPNRNDGTNGTPVPTFSTSNTALSCAAVTAQYNVSGKDKVECVSSTGAAPVSSVTLVLDAKQVTLPTVGLEKKDGKWVGFASVGAAQWVWVEIAGKKMKYKAQFKSQEWEAKEVEVKDEKDKKFKFEGGTVEYSGQNPFDTGSLNVGLIVGLTLAALALFAIAVGAALFAARRNRNGAILRGVAP